MADSDIKAAITARHGVSLPDDLIDLWSDPRSLLDDAPLVRLLAKLKDHRRDAWIPVVRDEDGPAGASKYAGTPWLAPGEAWPPCAHCGRPLQPFVQLGDDLPAEARAALGPGLVQLFYCTRTAPDCDLECDPFYPFSRSVLARRVPLAGAPPPPAPPSFEPRIEPARIVAWERVADYPDRLELPSLGVALADDEDDLILSLPMPEPGDKLLGWPLWVQHHDPPHCPRCDRPMRLLFQLTCSRNFRFDFGGGAVGYLTGCEEHADVLAFSWQR